MKVKIYLIGIMTVTVLSGANAQVRPLLNRSLEECEASYFQAVRPSIEESRLLADRSMSKIISAISTIEGAEDRMDFVRWSEARKNPQRDTMINISDVQSYATKEISDARSIRDKCWNYFDALPLGQKDLEKVTILIASDAPALQASPVLMSRILKKGASLDSEITKHDPITRAQFSGGLFPTLIGTASNVASRRMYVLKTPNDPTLLDRRYVAFISYLIAKVQKQETLNKFSETGRSRNGKTALAYAAINGDDDLINLLLNAGADPQVKNPGGTFPQDAGKTLIDFYTGKDLEVIKRLTGKAIRFNPQKVDELNDWDAKASLTSSQSAIGSSTAVTSVVKAMPEALVGSFSGVVNSSLQPNQPIASKGQIGKDGAFEYLGSNGVKMSGSLDTTGSGITGNGVIRLPEAPNGQKITYPNGTVEAEMMLNAKFDGQILRGTYSTKFESGEFKMCIESMSTMPECSVSAANPIESLLKGIGGVLRALPR